MIDALTHLDFPSFDRDRAGIVARARASGVTGWVIAGTDPAAWARTLAVARETGGFPALGVHPWWAPRVDLDTAIADLEARRPQAIGEIGLDRLKPGWERQQKAFRAQLAVARGLNCPVILHVVRAWADVRAILRRDGLPAAGGMVHGWTGPPAAVPEAEALGLMVSFGRGLLRPGRSLESSPRVSLDRLLVETDGEPAGLVAVVRALAVRRGVEVGEIERVTAANALRLFACRG